MERKNLILIPKTFSELGFLKQHTLRLIKVIYSCKILVLVLLFVGCDPKSKTSKTLPTLHALSGTWTGEWSWSKSQESTLEIVGEQVILTNFPIETSTGIDFLNQTGTVEEIQEYGAQSQPSLLLHMSNVNSVIVINFDNEYEGGNLLSYSVRERDNMQIKFRRKK